MSRARFIDADGRSFFDEISDAASRRGIYQRYRPVDTDWQMGAPFPAAEIETYRREVWFVPVGPLACPIGAPDERLDCLYRFERARAS